MTHHEDVVPLQDDPEALAPADTVEAFSEPPIADTNVEEAALPQDKRPERVISNEEASAIAKGLLQRLADERQRRWLPQRVIAERSGIGQDRISDFEHGKTNPRLDSFVRHLSALGGRITIEFDDRDGPHYQMDEEASE
jgi:ribosome-binding protein aMBF1 (putative translation factor)